MAILCDNCGWTGHDQDLGVRQTHLDDDAWGMGPSYYYEYFCPDCGEMDFTDGIICANCDEFVEEGTAHDCEDG